MRHSMRQRPATIPQYIQGAAVEAQPHLRRLYAILKSAAPKATETIKWGHPYFVEPRFLFAFSAHKFHVSFAPMVKGLEPFRKQLEKHETTKNFLKIPYDKPLPEALIRKIAKHCVRAVGTRDTDAFW
jgi:uncharacterized protein YdhG (YjbR/CyaY superfamily)